MLEGWNYVGGTHIPYWGTRSPQGLGGVVGRTQNGDSPEHLSGAATGGRGASWGRSGLAEPVRSQEEADPMNGELSVEGKRNQEGTSRGGGGGIETRWVQGTWGAGEHL